MILHAILYIFIFLSWCLFAVQAVVAPFTGWIWAQASFFHRDFKASHMLTGFIVHRDESPFHFWSTWVGYAAAAILLPFAIYFGVMQ
ncbi:MAG: hypothetical protein ABJN42_21080 [Roseibium sp.]|uniref:hypothetical protein n=1 Tax=Roseibium sp. TaxID=1936156 RepID=UPI00329816A4